MVRRGVALSFLGTMEIAGGGHVTSMPGTVAPEHWKAQQQDQERGWELGRGRATRRPLSPLRWGRDWPLWTTEAQGS